VLIEDEHFTALIFKRIEKIVAEFVIECERTSTRTEPVGSLVGMNNRLRICKYGPNGVFQRHYDSHVYIADQNIRSHYTVMVYLNDIGSEDGGATRFFKEDDLHNKDPPLLTIQPKIGQVLIFNHKMLHDGEKTLVEKYIMRSDLMFFKTPRTLEELLASAGEESCGIDGKQLNDLEEGKSNDQCGIS